MRDGAFLDERRLLDGPWQAFERDVARALICAGFADVRVIGGAGDRGGDILAVKGGKIWVVQCKHTSLSAPSKDAVTEVVNAGRFYEADRMVVACSRLPGPALLQEQHRQARLGIVVDVMGPPQLRAMIDKIPEYPPTRRPLREYQKEAVEKFREALIDVGRGQVVLATGLGKTVVMAELVADLYRDRRIQHDRILVLADKRELIKQLIVGFWHQLPKWVPTHILSGEEKPTFWDGMTFATVQSISSRQDVLPPFGLVLVDEAHHIGAPIFRDAIAAIAPPMLGGVTATPWRGDGQDIDDILGQPVIRVGIAEGLRKHFLAEVDYRLLADNIDWNLVQERSRHRYSLNQLNKRLIIPTRDDEAAREIAEVFRNEGRRGGIVFSSGIDHARHFAGRLRAFGLRAEAISSYEDARDRDRLMSRFRKGEIDIMTSVDLFNEGVDVPDVDLVAFMRVTHSRRIFIQQLGRGLRTSPNKDKVIVLDFVSDLRRLAEVVELERAARAGEIEKLPMGENIVRFRDASAGSFMLEWIKDQADLMLREGDAGLEVPRFDFPDLSHPGTAR